MTVLHKLVMHVIPQMTVEFTYMAGVIRTDHMAKPGMMDTGVMSLLLVITNIDNQVIGDMEDTQ